MAATMTRREALAALTGGMAFLLAPSRLESCGFSISAQGCLVSSREVQRLSATMSALYRPSREDMVMTTGNRSIDRSLGRALIRLTALFSQRPGVGFFDDYGEPNALATPETLIRGTWGTVLFGQQFFDDLMDHDRQGWGVLAVMAHEVGHIAQFRSGVVQRLQARPTTVRRVELHADLLSGYFLGVRKRQQPSIRVWPAGKALYSLGDYKFNHPGHHGTPEERVEAAEAGFRMGRSGRGFNHAFSWGVEYVLRNY